MGIKGYGMLAVLVAGVLVAGCGGGDGGTGVTTSSLSKQEYRRQANAICAKSTAAMMSAVVKKADAAGADAPPGEKARANVARKAILIVIPSALNVQADEIEQLGAPEGDEAKAEAYLQSLRKAARMIEVDEPTDAFALQEVLITVNPAAEAYGLDGCQY